MSWLDKYFNAGIKTIQVAGVVLPVESSINFAAGFTVVDDSTNGRTSVTATASAGGIGSMPQNASSSGTYLLTSGTDKGAVTAMTGSSPTAQLPAGPSNGDTYTVVYRNTTGSLTVSGNGNSIGAPSGGVSSETLNPGESATYTWFGTVNAIAINLWIRWA